MAKEAKRELQWVQVNYDAEGKPLVRSNVRVTEPDGYAYGRDVELDDQDLTGRAKAKGKNTWDEAEVLEAVGQKLAVQVKLPEKPPAESTDAAPADAPANPPKA